jgi:hypothetical protein
MKSVLIGTLFTLAITPGMAADQGGDFYALGQMSVQERAALIPMTPEELGAVVGDRCDLIIHRTNTQVQQQCWSLPTGNTICIQLTQ